jgi:hypothetical protein
MHRTQDTYPLSHFRQKTGEHLARLADGAIETITQNGEAVMIVMSPARYDALIHEVERGHLWDRSLARIEAGEDGVSSAHLKQALRDEIGRMP